MKLVWIVVPLAMATACSSGLAPAAEDSDVDGSTADAAADDGAALAPVRERDASPSEEEERDAGPDADAGRADAAPIGDASVDAASDAAATCREPYARCSYKTDTELDRQSSRQIAGSGCLGGAFVESETCDFTEQCDDTIEPVARCVSCGPEGARFATRDVDGARREECRGCGCGGWSVYGCYAETASFGQPWIDVVWQEGFEVLRFAVLQDGQVRPFAHADRITLHQSQLRAFELQPDGLVDWEVELDAAMIDDLQQAHAWDMHARVVGRCD